MAVVRDSMLSIKAAAAVVFWSKVESAVSPAVVSSGGSQQFEVVDGPACLTDRGSVLLDGGEERVHDAVGIRKLALLNDSGFWNGSRCGNGTREESW